MDDYESITVDNSMYSISDVEIPTYGIIQPKVWDKKSFDLLKAQEKKEEDYQAYSATAPLKISTNSMINKFNLARNGLQVEPLTPISSTLSTPPKIVSNSEKQPSIDCFLKVKEENRTMYKCTWENCGKLFTRRSINARNRNIKNNNFRLDGSSESV